MHARFRLSSANQLERKTNHRQAEAPVRKRRFRQPSKRRVQNSISGITCSYLAAFRYYFMAKEANLLSWKHSQLTW
jgi:hypothetical protein